MANLILQIRGKGYGLSNVDLTPEILTSLQRWAAGDDFDWKLHARFGEQTVHPARDIEAVSFTR